MELVLPQPGGSWESVTGLPEVVGSLHLEPSTQVLRPFRERVGHPSLPDFSPSARLLVDRLLLIKRLQPLRPLFDIAVTDPFNVIYFAVFQHHRGSLGSYPASGASRHLVLTAKPLPI